MRTRSLCHVLLLISSALIGCGDPTSSEPCLGDQPVTVEIPFGRLEAVFHEAQSDLELARFVFDRSVAGSVTATAEAVAPGRFVEAPSGAPIDPQGDELTSIRIDGLIGGAATDRIQAGGDQPLAIREIVQVEEPAGFRWIVGTVEGRCRRLHSNADAGVIVLAVTPP